MSVTIAIKNMVCPRCIQAVENFLKQTGVEVLSVDLGKATLAEMPDKRRLEGGLKNLGFELLEDKKQQQIAQIKALIISLVQNQEAPLKYTLSSWLAKEMNMDYPSLSALFSSQEHLTIERFYIMQRMEKVKELLTYGEQNLKEIAWRLGFNSVAHLSGQFKKETGMTVSAFKEQVSRYHSLRKGIDF